jgi:hypothetical protein
LASKALDLLLGKAVQDRFHASQAACGGFQHVEDLLLLDTPDQLRLVGIAVLAKHPTVKLDSYRLLQGGNALA